MIFKKLNSLNFLMIGIGVGVLILGFRTSNQALDKSLLALDGPNGHWHFHFSDGTEVSLPNVRSLTNYVEGKKSVQGKYLAEFDLPHVWFDQVKGSPAVFLPSAGGLKTVKIQNWKIGNFSSGSYNDVGPVILIPESTLKDSKKLKVEIEIDSPSHPYIGLLKGAPILGDVEKLQNLREKKIVFLKNLPLILSGIDFLLGVFFIWLGARLKSSDSLFQDQVYFLFCLSMFFFSLSGAVRDVSPFIGSIVHYPLNIGLSWSLARLVLKISKANDRFVQSLSWVYLSLFLLSLVAGICFLVKTQIFILVCARFGFIGLIFRLLKNRESAFQNFVFLIFILVGVFYFSDTLRLLIGLFSLEYPIQFSNRYTTQFTLLIPISFLAYQLIQNVSDASRKKAFEELALQVAHDIRSPLAALEMVSQEFQLLSEEARVLSRGAINRISDISNVLIREHRRYSGDLDLKDKSNSDRISLFLNPIIDSVVSEKRIEYRNRIGLQIYLNIEPVI